MNNKEYLKYLNDELKIFSNKSKEIDDIDLKTIKGISKRKRYLQSKLIKQFLNKNYMIRNTNVNHKTLEEGNFKFSYDYQRYDIKITQKDYLDFFYSCKEKDYYYYFTNCGMSSLYAAFTAFKKHHFTIDRIGNVYVEIERMLDEYLIEEKENKGKVLYIDSSSYIDLNELLKDKDLSVYQAFIFDTTDYLDDLCLPIINKLLEYNKIVCLVRSHIKLDMLGAEWNKLGSICVINPKNISKEDKKLSNELKESINIVLSVIGGFAYPENIPLIWNNPKFKEVNTKRVELIKKNSKYLYDRLLEVFTEEEICYPFHQMFVLLRINHKLTLEEVDKEIDKYIKDCKYKGLINFADSFGLDYYALSNYWESMAAEYPDVRIIVPDYPEEINKLIVDDMIIWLKKFYEKFN